MRIPTALLLLAAVAVAQEDHRGIVGVQARRAMNFRGRTMNMMSRAVGIVIGKDGLVLTSALGENAENVRVFMPGTKDPIEAEVIESDQDFSILRVAGLDAAPVEFRKDWKPKVGDKLAWMVLLAGPEARWASVRMEARVDALIEDEQGATLAYSDPPFNGPVTAACSLILDAAGKPVGVLIARRSGADGGGGGGRRGGMGQRTPALPLVRPASSFAHLLGGEVGARGILGVTGEALGENIAEAMGIGGTKGVLITQVTPGSGAADAGIQAQDIVTTVAGAATPTLPALQQALRGKKDGEEVAVELVRLKDGEPQKLSLKVELTAKESSDKSQRLRAKRFGFVAEPLTATIRRGQALPEDVKGLHVRRVTPGSPAALARPAGLRKGDIILKVGETPVTDLDTLRAALEEVANGTAVTLFLRNGKDTRFVDVRPEAPE